MIITTPPQKTYRLVDFAVPTDHRVKIIYIYIYIYRERERFLDLARNLT